MFNNYDKVQNQVTEYHILLVIWRSTDGLIGGVGTSRGLISGFIS
jgi:hypothetical protein